MSNVTLQSGDRALSGERRSMRRWLMLGAFFLANALPEFLWSNFPPIMTVVAAKYRVGEVAASLPVISFSIGTVLFASLAGRVIDRSGYRRSVLVGLFMLAVFAVLRAVDGPLWLLVLAQGGIGAAFSFIVAATSSYVVDWFEPRQEALVTGICMVGLYFGLGSSMIVTPLLLSTYGFAGMMRITAAAAAALFVLFVPLIRQRTSNALVVAGPAAGASLRLLKNRALLLLFIISFLQQGVFSAVATALELVWAQRGFSPQQAGLANGLFIFGGMAGSFLLPLLQNRVCTSRSLLIVCYLAALLLTYPLFVAPTPAVGNTIALIIGIFWLGSVPVALTCMEKIAGAEYAGTASSLYWAFGSAGAVVLVWLFSAIMESGSWQKGAVAMLAMLVMNELVTLALPREVLPEKIER